MEWKDNFYIEQVMRFLHFILMVEELYQSLNPVALNVIVDPQSFLSIASKLILYL